MVYKLTCSGCNSTCVCQTVRQLATRVDDHRKGSPVGQHLLECNKEVGGTAELKSKIIDQTAITQKLLTLEALNIWRERPRINTRDEFRRRKLTLQLKSMYNMAKIQKSDVSELENVPKWQLYNNERTKNQKSQNFTGKCYYWLRNLLCNYSCLNLIGQQNLRAVLDIILIFPDL